jgi:phosphatidylglycerol lysyltransferase
MCLYDWRAARAFGLQIAPRALIRNAWIANTFNNLIGLSGLAGSGIRMLLMTRDRIDARRAALFSALIMVSVPVGLAVLSWPLLLAGGPDMDRLPIAAWVAWLTLGAFTTYRPLYLFLLNRGAFATLLRGLAPPNHCGHSRD